jgi:hypothetical protein
MLLGLRHAVRYRLRDALKDPKSGWNLIEKYEKFSLGLIAFKLRPRFFPEPHWLTRYSFWFRMNAILDQNTVQIDGI